MSVGLSVDVAAVAERQAAALRARRLVAAGSVPVAHDVVVLFDGGSKRVLTRIGPADLAAELALRVPLAVRALEVTPIFAREFRERFLSAGEGGESCRPR